jgi:hypothetical protein
MALVICGLIGTTIGPLAELGAADGPLVGLSFVKVLLEAPPGPVGLKAWIRT